MNTTDNYSTQTKTEKPSKESGPMTDVNNKLTEMAINIGRMQTSITEIKNLQVDVVKLLRKLDRVDSRLDHLYEVVGAHNKDLNEIKAERIGARAKKEQAEWWFKNWRSIFSVFAVILAISMAVNPQLITLLKVAL